MAVEFGPKELESKINIPTVYVGISSGPIEALIRSRGIVRTFDEGAGLA